MRNEANIHSTLKPLVEFARKEEVDESRSPFGRNRSVAPLVHFVDPAAAQASREATVLPGSEVVLRWPNTVPV